jgi:hypothetical protein
MLPLHLAKPDVRVSPASGPSADERTCFNDWSGVMAITHLILQSIVLSQPIEMSGGDTLTVCGSHDRLSLRIWAEAPQAQ